MTGTSGAGLFGVVGDVGMVLTGEAGKFLGGIRTCGSFLVAALVGVADFLPVLLAGLAGFGGRLEGFVAPPSLVELVFRLVVVTAIVSLVICPSSI